MSLLGMIWGRLLKYYPNPMSLLYRLDIHGHTH
jgi:hypothetical protein